MMRAKGASNTRARPAALRARNTARRKIRVFGTWPVSALSVLLRKRFSMPDKTMLIIKIKPRDFEAIDAAMAAVRGIKEGQVMDVKKEPIGFGIEVIKAGILVDSKDEGAVERVTDEINALAEIEESEIEGMTLL